MTAPADAIQRARNALHGHREFGWTGDLPDALSDLLALLDGEVVTECADMDDCPTYYDGCQCVEVRRDGPERIYLEPSEAEATGDRLWCTDDDPGGTGYPWVPYIRADRALILPETEDPTDDE